MMTLFEPTDLMMLLIGFICYLCAVALHLERSRNYWRRRAQFFETQAYEFLRSNPIRPPSMYDDADWWKRG